jgi:hypothetical protein
MGDVCQSSGVQFTRAVARVRGVNATDEHWTKTPLAGAPTAAAPEGGALAWRRPVSIPSPPRGGQWKARSRVAPISVGSLDGRHRDPRDPQLSGSHEHRSFE